MPWPMSTIALLLPPVCGSRGACHTTAQTPDQAALKTSTKPDDRQPSCHLRRPTSNECFGEGGHGQDPFLALVQLVEPAVEDSRHIR